MKDHTDSHIHLADPELNEVRDSMVSCSLFLSCTAKPSEWPVQRSLSENDERIFAFYGTHPWFIGEHDNDLLENILNECPDAGVGEIGLDAMTPDLERQMDVFGQQLSLAEEYRRPVAIHMVKTEKETLDTLRVYSNIPRKILHSFSSESYVKPFADIDCYFSVSPRLLNKSDERIESILRSIPIERLLIESDLPGCNGSMEELIMKISSVLSMNEDEVIDITGRNARDVIS